MCLWAEVSSGSSYVVILNGMQNLLIILVCSLIEWVPRYH